MRIQLKLIARSQTTVECNLLIATMHTVIGDKSSSCYTTKKQKHPKQTKNKQTNTNKWRLGGPIPQFPSAAIVNIKILTNVNFCSCGSLSTSTVADNTLVASFIQLLDSGNS